MASPTGRSIDDRDRALALSRSITRGVAIGGVGLAATLAVLAGATFPGRSTASATPAGAVQQTSPSSDPQQAEGAGDDGGAAIDPGSAQLQAPDQFPQRAPSHRQPVSSGGGS